MVSFPPKISNATKFWNGVFLFVNAYEKLEPVANSIKALQKLRVPEFLSLGLLRAGEASQVVEGAAKVLEEAGTNWC